MKKNFFKVLFVLIVIFSLGLNILLLYEKMNNKEDNVETIEPSTKKMIIKIYHIQKKN